MAAVDSRTLLRGTVRTQFVGPSEGSIYDDVIYMLHAA
jgi:hypothetical protein